jgi:photosystem II stability/assembly factor-like uncharacterized protein
MDPNLSGGSVETLSAWPVHTLYHAIGIDPDPAATPECSACDILVTTEFYQPRVGASDVTDTAVQIDPMKKALTSMLMFSFLNITHAQWYQIPSPYAGNMWCIDFFDENVGYIGCNTAILKTVDGGNSWTSTNVSDFLVNGFAFPSGTVGYYGANNNVVRKTTNQGDTWTLQNPNVDPFGIMSLSFPDVSTGYAVGSAGVVRKTTNGGTTWTTQNASAGLSDLQEVHFFNTLEGLCIGEDGKIRRTTNGGTSWSLVSSGTSENLYDMFFVDASTGYISGANGTILKTTNGGQSWTAQTSGTTEWLYAICFKNALEGIAGASGGLILRTSNGGATWVQEEIGVFLGTMHINDLIYKNGRYIAVGDQGRMATDQPLVGIEEEEQAGPMITISPNPASDLITVNIRNAKERAFGFYIYNSVGELMMSGSMNSDQQRIDVGELPAGNHLVELRSDKATFRRKLVLER